jgi:hypothetical protein
MSKIVRIMFAVAALSALTATTAFAAGPPEKSDSAFVCPVLGGQAGMEHGQSNPDPLVSISGGDYTVGGPAVSVPILATNGEGAGSPGGDHSSPGDTDYTAIWSGLQ